MFACMLGGEDGRTLLICAAPDFLEHRRMDKREAVLLTTTVDVPARRAAVGRQAAVRASELARGGGEHLVAQVADLGVVGQLERALAGGAGSPTGGRCARARARSAAHARRRVRARSCVACSQAVTSAPTSPHQVGDEREVEQALLAGAERARALERLARAVAVEGAQAQPPEPLPRRGVRRRGGALLRASRRAPA